jgi:Peptidase A4 family
LTPLRIWCRFELKAEYRHQRNKTPGTGEINMKPFSEIRFLLVRAMRESSSPPKGKMRLLGLVAVLGIAMAGLLVPGAVRAGAPDSGQHDASTVARARAAFLKHMSSHRPMVPSNLGPLAAGGGATSLPSYNWSGFADAEGGSKTVSSVSGQWVIPYVECPSGLYQYQDAFIAQWVGIDGFSNDTVEQLGTATQCFEGVTYYYVWYEMFPAGTIEEGTVACINNNVDCPQPGDRISASVTVTAGGNYTLSLTDFSRPQESFSVTASCAPSTCLDSSAEWIVERPAFELPFGFQILPLVDFFQTGFSNGALTSGGKATDIEGFRDGTVYDMPMIDDSDSYFLDCVGQRGFGHLPQLLETTNPNACPTVAPSKGSFAVTWDSSF